MGQLLINANCHGDIYMPWQIGLREFWWEYEVNKAYELMRIIKQGEPCYLSNFLRGKNQEMVT